MTNAPRTARLAKRIAYRASFFTGMVAALPEFGPARAFRIAQPIVARIEAIAPSEGGFGDGYDLIADIAATPSAKRSITRDLIRCFLRGNNDVVSA